MPDDPNEHDSLAPAVRNRSRALGDVPHALKRRYYTEELGGEGIGFYVDARIQAPAFRDRGRELVAGRLDPNAIRDMATIAQHRGWTIVTARGSADFRREAWLAGRSIGLEVRGYRPSERDLQALQRRQDRAGWAEGRQEDKNEKHKEPRDSASNERQAQRERPEDADVQARMRVVEAVVRARVAEPDVQDRIIASARNRLASWLERGARIEPLPTVEKETRAAPERRRDR